MLKNKLQNIVSKFIPGNKKREAKIVREQDRAKFFGDVTSAVVGIRGEKAKLPKSKTPAEHNEVMRKFNSNPKVRKMQDKIYEYKVKKSTGSL